MANGNETGKGEVPMTSILAIGRGTGEGASRGKVAAAGSIRGAR